MTTHPDDRGVPRQDHYGPGRQPFDDILDAGWAPAFAAGNVLKYLRLTKEPEHSLESARWYYARLFEMSQGDPAPRGSFGPFSLVDRHAALAEETIHKLEELLTPDELKLLRGDR